MAAPSARSQLQHPEPMQGVHPSLLSLAASGLYLVVIAACILACLTAVQRRQQPWHGRNWALIAVLFAVLAFMRWAALEEVLRDFFRDLLKLESAYEGRRDTQRLLTTSVIGLSVALGVAWLAHMSRGVRGKRNIAVLVASASAAGLVCLLALRLISLHQIDAILYRGPIRLNWLLDVGASLAVLGAAFVYVRTVGRRSGAGRAPRDQQPR